MVLRMRILVFLTGLFLVFWPGGPAYALIRVYVVGGGAEESAEFVNSLQAYLRDEGAVTSGDPPATPPDALVVLGTEAYRKLPDKHPPAVLLAPSGNGLELAKGDSAVYWSPSLSAQLALIRYLLPATNRVGMLVNNPDDMAWAKAFRQYAADQSVDIRILQADRQRLARQVADLAASCDVLLAQPDPELYNRDTIRLVLLAAYRQNRVFVGPSPAFVRAGALATLYAPTPAIAEAVGQKLLALGKSGRLSPPTRIRNLSVSLNPQVSRALGLAVPAINELERLLHFEELPAWP